MKCKKVFFCFSMPQLTSTGFFLGRFGEVAWISLRFNVAAELLASTGLGLCLGLVFPEASRGRTPDDRGNFRVPWAPKSTLGLGFPNKILMDWFPYKVMLDQIDFCWVRGDLHLIIFYHFQKKKNLNLMEWYETFAQIWYKVFLICSCFGRSGRKLQPGA